MLRGKEVAGEESTSADLEELRTLMISLKKKKGRPGGDPNMKKKRYGDNKGSVSTSYLISTWSISLKSYGNRKLPYHMSPQKEERPSHSVQVVGYHRM